MTYYVIKPDGEVKMAAGIMIIAGGISYFCQDTHSPGWGEGDEIVEKQVRPYPLPYFSRTLLEKYGCVEKAKNKQLSLQDALANSNLEKCVLRLGKNECGIEVISDDEYRARRENQTPLEVIWFATDYEALGDLYTLNKRVDKATWSKIAHCMFYFECEDELMCNGATKGWAIKASHLSEVEVLLAIPHDLRHFCSCSTCTQRYAKEETERQEAESAYKQRQKAEHELKNQLNELFLNAEYPSADECQKVASAERWHPLGIKGESIYGTGCWYHITDTHLWQVVNHGMDGDDWSRNNYPTGGAGAIAHRILLTDEIKKLIDRINEFDRN